MADCTTPKRRLRKRPLLDLESNGEEEELGEYGMDSDDQQENFHTPTHSEDRKDWPYSGPPTPHAPRHKRVEDRMTGTPKKRVRAEETRFFHEPPPMIDTNIEDEEDFYDRQLSGAFRDTRISFYNVNATSRVSGTVFLASNINVSPQEPIEPPTKEVSAMVATPPNITPLFHHFIQGLNSKAFSLSPVEAAALQKHVSSGSQAGKSPYDGTFESVQQPAREFNYTQTRHVIETHSKTGCITPTKNNDSLMAEDAQPSSSDAQVDCQEHAAAIESTHSGITSVSFCTPSRRLVYDKTSLVDKSSRTPSSLQDSVSSERSTLRHSSRGGRRATCNQRRSPYGQVSPDPPSPPQGAHSCTPKRRNRGAESRLEQSNIPNQALHAKDVADTDAQSHTRVDPDAAFNPHEFNNIIECLGTSPIAYLIRVAITAQNVTAGVENERELIIKELVLALHSRLPSFNASTSSPFCNVFREFIPWYRECKTLDMFPLTPLAKSAVWYTDRTYWVWFSTFGAPGSRMRDFLSGFFAQLQRLDEAIFMDLARGDEFQLANMVFMTPVDDPPVVKNAIYLTNFGNAFFAFDRICWAMHTLLSTNDSSQVQRPKQARYSFYMPVHDDAQLTVLALETYYTTIAEFCIAWQDNQTTYKDSRPEDINSTEAAVKALVNVYSEIDECQYLLTVQQNVTALSLNLHSLAVPWDGNPNDKTSYLDRLLIHLGLQNIRLRSELRRDTQFMRPISHALAFSIISLLGRSQLTKKSSNKLSFSKYPSAFRYIHMAPSATRLEIENDLWNLALQEVLHGPGIYYPGMALYVKKWDQMQEIGEEIKKMRRQRQVQRGKLNVDAPRHQWETELKANEAENPLHCRVTGALLNSIGAVRRREILVHPGWLTKVIQDAVDAAPAQPQVVWTAPQAESIMSTPHRPLFSRGRNQTNERERRKRGLVTPRDEVSTPSRGPPWPKTNSNSLEGQQASIDLTVSPAYPRPPLSFPVAARKNYAPLPAVHNAQRQFSVAEISQELRESQALQPTEEHAGRNISSSLNAGSSRTTSIQAPSADITIVNGVYATEQCDELQKTVERDLYLHQLRETSVLVNISDENHRQRQSEEQQNKESNVVSAPVFDNETQPERGPTFSSFATSTGFQPNVTDASQAHSTSGSRAYLRIDCAGNIDGAMTAAPSRDVDAGAADVEPAMDELSPLTPLPTSLPSSPVMREERNAQDANEASNALDHRDECLRSDPNVPQDHIRLGAVTENLEGAVTENLEKSGDSVCELSTAENEVEQVETRLSPSSEHSKDGNINLQLDEASLVVESSEVAAEMAGDEYGKDVGNEQGGESTAAPLAEEVQLHVDDEAAAEHDPLQDENQDLGDEISDETNKDFPTRDSGQDNENQDLGDEIPDETNKDLPTKDSGQDNDQEGKLVGGRNAGGKAASQKPPRIPKEKKVEPIWPTEVSGSKITTKFRSRTQPHQTYHLPPLPIRPIIMTLPHSNTLIHLTFTPVDLKHLVAFDLDGEVRMRRKKYSFICYPGLEKGFDDIKVVSRLAVNYDREILSGPDINTSDASCIAYFTDTEWSDMNITERLKVFSRRNVQIVGGKNPIPAFKSWDDYPVLAEHLVLEAPRCIHDLQTRVDTGESIQQRMFKGSLYDIIEAQKAPFDLEFGRRTLNCLDIDVPVPPVPIPNIQYGFQLEGSNTHFYSWATKYPPKIKSWAIMSLKGSISDAHIDASGFATWICMVSGTKIFFLSHNNPNPGRNGWNVAKLKWQAVVLEKGCTLIMRPGTIHCAVTAEDSFLVGGHFYSTATYSATSRAVVWEHFYGTSITNSVEERSLIILIKSLFQLIAERQDWLSTDDRAADNNVERRIARQPVTMDELAALVTFILYIDKLPPECHDEEEGSTLNEDGRWRSTSDFKGDFHWAKMMCYEFYKHCNTRQQGILTNTQAEFVEFLDVMNKKTRTAMQGIQGRDFNTVMVSWDEASPDDE